MPPRRQLRAVLWRGEINDGEDAGRIADQLDQLRDDARASDIEGGIHAGWRELSDPFHEARSIGRRDSSKLAQMIMVWSARGADHGEPSRLFERQIVRFAGPDPGSQNRVLRQHVETTAEDGDVGKPPTLTWREAAGLPLAELTAHRGIVQTLRIRRADRVLVLGAG